jgi:hypothetical protein
VQIVGGVNATALIFAGVAPLMWIAHAVWVVHEVTLRRALAVVVKIGVLTLATSAWWIAGLSLQSGYGLNVLKYTETLEVVSQASLPAEVMRGLGYWFFYGRDKLGLWTESSFDYMARPSVIAVGFAIPVLALCAAAIVRWRHRAYFVLLALVGVVIALDAGRPVQVVRRVVELRLGPPQHGAGRPPDRPGVRRAPRGRGQRRVRRLDREGSEVAGPGARRSRDRPGARQLPRALARHVLR